jgi:superfamily II DNA or RNA helicase
MPDDDVSYDPDLSRLSDSVSRLHIATALIIGEPDVDRTEYLRSLVSEIRYTVDRSVMREANLMPAGAYFVRLKGVWHLLVRPGVPSATDRARADCLSRLSNDFDPLVIAADLVSERWAGAYPLTEEDVLPPGAHVLLVGTNDFGRIVSHRRVEDTVQYLVDVRGSHKTVSGAQLTALAGDANDPYTWMSVPPANAAETALTVAWTKLRNPLTDVLYSFQASRTLFRPYQFKPVLKIVQGEEQRLLIADEVGLGKTIEAGLVWSELEGRSPLDRVLVLCPAALTVKWQTEMQRRFDRRHDLHGRHDWDDFFDRLADGRPAPMLGVDSIERLRMTDVPDRLVATGVRFDLVIVDEAHKLRNASTRTHVLGSAVADAADALIFLTATPVNLGNRDLFTLLGLLDEGRFSDLRLFELESEPNARVNRAASLLLDRSVSPRVVRVELLALHGLSMGRSILERPDAVQLLALLDTDAPLTATEVSQAKRLLAGLGTFSTYITRTRKVDVPDAKAVRVPTTLKVEWTADEQRFYDAVRAWVAARAGADGTPPGFAEQMPLRQTASCIPAMAERIRLNRAPEWDDDYRAEVDDGFEDSGSAALPELSVPVPGKDTKLEVLLEALQRVRDAGLDRVMVFSYFRLTLAYLDRQLRSRGYSTRVMHGGVKLDEREAIMAEFRAGAFEVLLISEVGSEGLDFEHCGALVNYDLPWNPMRVEQRIGRLDRFGQAHEKILIFNFAVDGTIEDRILLRLYERIGVFRESIGELEPIISQDILDIRDLLVDVRLTRAQQEERAHRIEVALEEKELQIDELRRNEGSLTNLDRVLIDGFEADNPGRGRFVGPHEVAALVGDLARRTEGHLTWDPSRNMVTLSGTPLLAARLRAHLQREARPNPDTLIQRVQDGRPTELALTPAAAEAGLPLLHVRHPLVRIALDEIQSDPLGLKRFGHVALSPQPTQQFLGLLTLMDGRGMRGFLRLEPTVVSLEGVPAPDVAEALLQAFATGKVRDGVLALPEHLVSAFQAAELLADVARLESERELQQYNASLIAARRASLTHGARIKVDATERRMAAATDERILRMHRGRIRNLNEHLQLKLQELENVAALVTGERVAVIVIDR